MAKKPKVNLKKVENWHKVDSKPYLEIQSVSKYFDGAAVVNQVSLEIYQGEFFSLLGPSGCGKTTLLRMLAGLETPDEGCILIDGVDMTNVPAYERPVNMMFQSYALFPHMTVEQNVAFGLVQDKLPKAVIKERVKEALAQVQMEKYAERRPHQLSGGQRQRAALARCIIKKPKLVLLDEPLAALDRQLRENTQFELVNIQEQMGLTFLMVTHDQEEAMTMSTRLGIMEEGKVRQVGSPHEIYEFPNSVYVADFIGSMNIFQGVVREESRDSTVIQCEELSAEVVVNHGANAPCGANVWIALRPEKVTISKKKPQRKYNTASGIVQDIAYLGDVSIYLIQLEGTDKIVEAMLPNLMRSAAQDITWEDTVYLSWEPENTIVLTA
ncbi:MAG: polyamine ABC transporter ATP-binding protein [Alphaproteobacteria bacterium]|nr:polyamine ABC transporter ATP-binding protein [Alphaproteobacteria bacterium]